MGEEPGGSVLKALHIFEDNDATRYAHYESLSRFLRELWVRWNEFSDTKSITTTFLSSSVIYDDFVQPISWMTTPRNAPQRLAEMAQLRNTARQAAIELYSNRGLIQNAMARLEEANNGHGVSPFCGLPTPDHESLPSEDEDTDSDEEVIAFGGIKDHNLLEENGFDPIWIQGHGYPGTPPPELQEYLFSESTRACDMIGSIRSIFWLFGRKDLVQVVDDPACLLKDEIIDVPRGINPVGYLINYYSVEGKIPLYIQEVYDGKT